MKRTRMQTRRAALGSLAISTALACAALAWGQGYAITDLGTLTGGANSDAFGLNNFGRVVGVSSLTGAHYHGFFDPGGLVDIPPLPGDLDSHAFAINSSDQVAATSYVLGGVQPHGLLWQAGNATNLGNIAAHAVNSAGLVVGYLSTLQANFGWVDHAALWQTGSLFDLGTLGGHNSYAYAIADDGRIVGMSFMLDDTTHRATLWQNSVPHDLGTLGGIHSQAYDINNTLSIVGVADTGAGQPHACLFVVDANANVLSRTDLGVLGGGYSYAYGINAGNTVVGTSNAAAFRWRSGLLEDLNGLIAADQSWRLDAARRVNDAGQIVGTGLHFGQPRGFLLTPFLLGDMNCDGAVGLGDVNPFVLAMSNPSAWQLAFPGCSILNGDINHDGVFSFGDINPFVALLSGQGD